MGSIVDYIAEQKEAEEHTQQLNFLKEKFVEYFGEAQAKPSELHFWLWLTENKEKVARFRRLIDL